MIGFENTEAFASELDAADKLKDFRKEFLFPQHNGQNVIYLTGNSLGLEPKGAREALLQELDDWGKYGVEGHFEAKNPWFAYHEMFKPLLAEIVGAKPIEVTALNGLTANLHFLMVSFYRPKGERYKILCEAKAFPSDQYALESQVKFHGYDPDDAIIELSPREGEHTIREEDILECIEENAQSIALIMIGGVNYYSGQLFDMKSITEVGHRVGAKVGFDLAHGVGNVELKLHDWQVDFAAWCSYKYLNSGPGSVAGIFVHENHANNKDLHRFAGWWGNDASSRFKMEKGFIPAPGADSWQVSNAPIFSMAVHKVAVELFVQATMPALFEKRDMLTAYLEFVIEDVSGKSSNLNIEIITPKDKEKRGSQLSLISHGSARELFDKITEQGVIADWREPNVIRIAPVPMYNSYMDAYNFGQILKNASEV